MRLNPELIKTDQVQAVPTSAEAPDIHLRLEADNKAHNRVLTKIGLNLVAKMLGEEFVREPEFDASVAFARDGTGSIRTSQVPSNALLECSFKDRHVMWLFAHRSASANNPLLFRVQLFGGPVQQFQLAEFTRHIPGIEHGIVLHVDYRLHRVERLSLEQFVRTLVPEQWD